MEIQLHDSCFEQHASCTGVDLFDNKFFGVPGSSDVKENNFERGCVQVLQQLKGSGNTLPFFFAWLHWLYGLSNWKHDLPGKVFSIFLIL